MHSRRKILGAIAAIAVMTFILGCGAINEIKKHYQDRWYVYDSTKTASLSIPTGTSDEENAAESSSISIAKLYARYNEKEGLKIVVEQEKADSGKAKPLCGSKTYASEQFGLEKWIALVELGNMKESETPNSISNKTGYIDISEIKEGMEGIQWNRVLANIILKMLE